MHGKALLGMHCVFTSVSMVSLPVWTVFASCVFVSRMVRSLPFSMLFTGNTQTSHPIAPSPPRRPPHKGTDIAVILAHYMSDLYLM